MANAPDPGPAQERSIRIFISSTFRDMQAERDELIKRTFPQLRQLCERRGVAWGEVDLRWGITDEQKAEGKVLPICLAEIRNCRPYFLGLLGDRYGWIQEEIPAVLLEQEPWLGPYGGRSVTELEILHGVLNDPAMAAHAFFYFRDPAYVRSVPAAQQPVFRESAATEEIARYGAVEAERRAEERRQKLIRLKQQIRASRLPVRDNYADPRALGELVLADLTAVIDRLYPEGSRPDALDREAADHAAFARSRAAVHVGRQHDFDRLDAHAAGEDSPLAVLGASGLGKSALLAVWGLRYRASHPDQLVLMHFIGSSPASTDWAGLVRRILGELARRLGMDIKIPDNPHALRATFANALHMAGAKASIVLIIDGLDQLEDRDGAPDLAWLPAVLPRAVRLLVSARPGRALDELAKRGWPTLEIAPLGEEERRRLIREYLKQYTKELSPVLAAKIATASPAANPLYLRTLLEELRLWGEPETLDAAIDDYLAAATPQALYARILARWERDYAVDRADLVRDAMSLLSAARRGLSESELLDLLGANGEPLPHAYWSPLRLAAGPSLVSRSGLLGFSHDYLRGAVEDRYLPRPPARQAAHLRLASYFAGRHLDGVDLRQVDELPWQLAAATQWERLAQLLSDLRFLAVAWDNDQFEVKAYWAQVEANSPARAVDAYRGVWEDPVRHLDHAWRIEYLLADTGHAGAALAIGEALIRFSRSEGTLKNLADALDTQGLNLGARGDLVAALEQHRQAEAVYRKIGDERGVAHTLANQAGILINQGRLDEAERLLAEDEQLRRSLGDPAAIGINLGNQGLLFAARGEPARALSLRRQEEAICRQLGDLDGLARSLGDQALIVQRQGRLDDALRLAREAEKIGRQLGNVAIVQAALGNQAGFLVSQLELDQAMTLAKEQERLSRILPQLFGLGQSLSLQAAILRHRSDWQGAGELYGQAESLYRSIGNSAGYLASLINHAAILLAHDWSGALALLRIAEPVVRELGQLKAFAANLMSQAIALRKGGRHGEAMALLRSCEGFWRELGDERMLGECLGNQANILWDQGNAEAALRTYKQAEAIARRVGDDESVATSLLNMARLIDEDLHSPDRALPLAEEGLRVARAAGLADHEQELGLLVDSLRRRASERPRAPSWWQRLRKIGKSDE